ncbi:beta-lactamase family protein [Leucobacter coleopterorum]|uniref:Beta-lactamase family protein n=1 Tax=Leucobacter coleopterorum TaxID=2714933 RepID=A0ABX6K0U1_9MICO|nr:beta-lactamase family protein [Leucobacter coleopterorum]
MGTASSNHTWRVLSHRGLFASGSDLLHWMKWLSSAFSYEPGAHDEVLSAASRREMQQLHRANPAGAPGVTSGYGYGVVVEHSGAEGHVVSHSGGYPGFSAHMRWSLDHGLSVCGLENAGYAGVHHAVRKTMSGLLTGSKAQSVIAWPETQSAVARVRELLENPSDQLLWERTESELFDSCVALDLPIQDRRDQIVRLQAASDAPLTQTSPAFPTPASAHWELRGNPNTLRVTLQMTPLNPPRVQRIDVSLSEADTPT